jgi:hypothetical protein
MERLKSNLVYTLCVVVFFLNSLLFKEIQINNILILQVYIFNFNDQILFLLDFVYSLTMTVFGGGIMEWLIYRTVTLQKLVCLSVEETCRSPTHVCLIVVNHGIIIRIY